MSRKNLFPSDLSTRKTEAIVEKKGETFRVIKGAVSAVMQACGTKEDEKVTIEQKVDILANKGYRVMVAAIGREAVEWI